MTNYLLITLFFAALSFFAAWSLTPILIAYLAKNNRMEVPNGRSSHLLPTPSFGGIVFLPAVLLVALLYLTQNLAFSGISFMIALSGIVGWIDDAKNISPLRKLGLQFLVALGVYSMGLSINTLFTLIGIPIENQLIDFLLTTLLILSFMNAFNLIDGIDGLAGGIAILSSITFSILFFLTEDWSFFCLSIVLTSSILGFLIFNFPPAKIFMGDTGSLLLGCYLIVCFLHVSTSHSSYFIIAFSTLIYPFLDMLRLFLGRILLKRTPFGADRNHYHHLLLQNGFDHRKSTLTIYIIHAAIILGSIGLFGRISHLHSLFLLSIISLFCYIFIQFLFARTLFIERKKIARHIEHVSQGNYLIKKHLS